MSTNSALSSVDYSQGTYTANAETVKAWFVRFLHIDVQFQAKNFNCFVSLLDHHLLITASYHSQNNFAGRPLVNLFLIDFENTNLY